MHLLLERQRVNQAIPSGEAGTDEGQQVPKHLKIRKRCYSQKGDFNM